MSLLITAVVDQMTFEDPFNPKHSMILQKEKKKKACI